MERIIVPKGSLEVFEFEPAVADAIAPIDDREFEDFFSRFGLQRRSVANCAAALAALALHALLVAPLWSGGAPKLPQKRSYPGKTAALQWVVLEDSTGGMIGRPSLPSLSLTAIGISDAPPALPILPAEASDAGSGDRPSGLGAMSGRYLGQIHARIERAWLRPRTAIGAPLFQCQVQVDQDNAGRVLDIALIACNGGTRWQLSLVHAIDAASPLPAPPNRAVFIHHVLLTFRAMAYSAGVAAQLYEPQTAMPVGNKPGERNTLPGNEFQTIAQSARAHSGKGIALRIEGSKVSVEPEHH